MISQPAMQFAGRLAAIFEVPKGAGDGFLDALAEASDGFSGEVYDRAFRKLRDTRKYRTLPMPAEAKAVCEDQASFLSARHAPAPAVAEPERDWSPEAAFEFCRRTAVAATAARDGWIGPLIGFVRQQRRLPEPPEFRQLQLEQRKFEDALAMAMDGRGMPELVRLGSAMAKRHADYAAAILGEAA